MCKEEAPECVVRPRAPRRPLAPTGAGGRRRGWRTCNWRWRVAFGARGADGDVGARLPDLGRLFTIPRQPSTYSPGLRSSGMITLSTIWPPVQSPEHSPFQVPGSFARAGFLQSGWPLQSCGHGGAKDRHMWPWVPDAFGHKQPELGSPNRGTGFRAQVDPFGEVPSSTQTHLSGYLVPLFHISACLVRSNSNGSC